jgi:uncharacterized membrane protein YgcG
MVWIEGFSKQLQPAIEAAVVALRSVWHAQQGLLRQAWARATLGALLAVGLLTALANAWGVPALNRRLPQAVQQAAQALQRDVEVGRVRWVAPTGVVGLTPLASFGPVSVGPGPAEHSSATIERVALSVDPLRSLARGRIVLALRASGGEVHLRQADNFSWFGFPDDTSPSARNFLPGLGGGGGAAGGAQGPSNGGGGGGGRRGGGGAARRSALAAAQAAAAASAPGAPVAAPNGAALAQSFLDRVAGELLAWHAKEQAALQAAQQAEAAPALVLMGAGGPVRPSWQATAGLDLHSSSAGEPAPGGSAGGAAGPAASAPAQGSGGRSFLPFFGGGGASTKADASRPSQQQQLDALNATRLSAQPRNVLNVQPQAPAASAAPPPAQRAAEPQPPAAARVNAQLRPLATSRQLYTLTGGSAGPAAAAAASSGAAPAPAVVFEDPGTGGASSSSESDHEAAQQRAAANVPSRAGAALINSLPQLQVALRRAPAPPPPPAEAEVRAAPRGPSRAAQMINSLGAVTAPDCPQPVQALLAGPRAELFANAVVDPATVRRKGALPAQGPRICSSCAAARSWRRAPPPPTGTTQRTPSHTCCSDVRSGCGASLRRPGISGAAGGPQLAASQTAGARRPRGARRGGRLRAPPVTRARARRRGSGVESRRRRRGGGRRREGRQAAALHAPRVLLGARWAGLHPRAPRGAGGAT